METYTEPVTAESLAEEWGVDEDVVEALAVYFGVEASDLSEDDLHDHYLGSQSLYDYAEGIVDDYIGSDDFLRQYVAVEWLERDLEAEGYRSIRGHLFRP